jgi:hypothetical protein
MSFSPWSICMLLSFWRELKVLPHSSHVNDAEASEVDSSDFSPVSL